MGDAVILSSMPLGWTRVVLVGHYQPLSWWAVGPLPVLFGPVPGDPGMPCVLGLLESPCPLGGPVGGLARLLWM